MHDRSFHRWLLTLCCLVLVWQAPGSVSGFQQASQTVAEQPSAQQELQDPTKPPLDASPQVPQPDQVDQAIDRAIAYLLTEQQENGSFGNRSHDTTMTALGVMALACVGTTPDQNDQRGQAMRRALDFVLTNRQEESGYFGKRDGSRMYGHGIITLMLSEMLGMGADQQQDNAIQEQCEKGIQLILESQKQNKPPIFRGGWRYTPDANDSDLSVSVWQVMALRSAKTDGIEVPDQAISQAIDYFRRSCTSPLDGTGVPLREEAGFSYTPGSDQIKFTMTAAGLLAMQVCGQYESPLVEKSADWLLAHPPKHDERFFYYGAYYYAQGMYQRGGAYHEAARDHIRQILLEKQQADGHWEGYGEEAGAGPVYTTCLAILSLGVKYHYLPIYQK